MSKLDVSLGKDPLIDSLHKALETKLQELALAKAEEMADKYSKYLREQFTHIATSAALDVTHLISMERYGSVIRIELKIEDKK